MASAQPFAASSGALSEFASYLNGTLINLSVALQESSEYVSEALGISPTVVYTGLAALVAVPLTMTRYGWSLGRDASSPYASMSSLPEVGDDDFSYITSQDIDDRYSDSRHHARAHTTNPADLEDDILHIRNKGVTYPAHFPAYSIGDGKLYVSDVRDRIALMMDLPSCTTERIKLLYKDKQLMEPTMPIRDYGVKNRSEIIATIRETDDDSSLSGREGVSNVAGAARNDSRSKSRRKKKGKRRPERPNADSPTSPRDSNGQVFSSPKSPQASNAAAAAAAVAGPMKKLSGIAEEFDTKWVPLCRAYIKAPPSDAKKREEGYMRLSESLMQHIILKLDGVATEGIDAVRARRKELVDQVQKILRELDAAKSS